MLQVEAEAQKLRFFDRVKGRVFQHPASINFHSGRFESGWLVYTDLIETSKVRLGSKHSLHTQCFQSVCACAFQSGRWPGICSSEGMSSSGRCLCGSRPWCRFIRSCCLAARSRSSTSAASSRCAIIACLPLYTAADVVRCPQGSSKGDEHRAHVALSRAAVSCRQDWVTLLYPRQTNCRAMPLDTWFDTICL